MKKIISLLLIFSIVLSLFSVASAEEDYLPEEKQILNVLSALKIMNGDEMGNFCLDSNVTRAEFSKMAVAASAYRNAVSEVSRISPFHDVPYTYWGASYIKAALDAGFVKGYPDSTFKPEGNVTLAEGVTIVLKMLGYKDEDFGAAVWPSGQMSLATDLEILDNIKCSVNEVMTRRDVMHLFYNGMTTPLASGASSLLSSFGYTYYEDTVLIASVNEDLSIPANKVLTSAGQFEINDNFDMSKIGYKGDMIIKNGSTVVSFITKNQKAGEYTLNTIIDDDMLVYSGSETYTIKISDNTDIYYKSQKTGLSGIMPSVSLGDSVTVFKNLSGDIEYIMVGKADISEPFVFEGDISKYGIKADTVIYINGVKSSASDLMNNDIVYYSEPVNTVWAYRKKVIGIYEQAIPNKDNPQSIKISGLEYSFETSDMYKAFATGGSYNIGDTVTVYLGRNDKIAGASKNDGVRETSEIIGYVTKVGNKVFEKINGDTYSSNYIGLVKADGTYLEYPTQRLYENYKSSVVKASIRDSVATLQLVTKKSVTGVFDSVNNTLGDNKIAQNCEFIDIAHTSFEDEPDYVKVYKTRLDEINFRSGDILYYTSNENGEIDSIFLNNVTRDVYEYGIVTEERGTSYSVKCGVNTYSVSGYPGFEKYSVVGVGIKDNKVYAFKKLVKVANKINYVDAYTLETSKETYKVSENCQIYIVDESRQWQIGSFSDITEDSDITAYYDSSSSSGGRIRVIVIR